MPRKAVGRQPPQSGPAWDAFVRYWKRAIDGNGSRAAAWRAFHAGWEQALLPDARARSGRAFDAEGTRQGARTRRDEPPKEADAIGIG